MTSDKLKIFSGNATPALAVEICDYIGVPLGKCSVGTFSDGEIYVKIDENVRGADVFLINSTSPPVNRHLMELLMMIDAARRASAQHVTAVLPYYGYARQDRKDQPRVPITSKLVANLIVAAGAQRVLTIDLHALQIQGFFDIMVDHLFALKVLTEYYRDQNLGNFAIVSPDTGNVKRCRAFAGRLNAPLVIIDKRRPEGEKNKSEVMNVIGDVEGLDVLIVDDMIDTGGTIIEAAQALRKAGAKRVFACCTHPILSGNAVERLCNSCIEHVVVTNTVPLKPEAQNSPKIKVLSVGPLLGEAIKRIHEQSSVSSLFD